jgi:NhaP-type Na+/H+ or K+/H+ antiporter
MVFAYMRDLNIALALISGLILALDLSTGLLQSRDYLPSEPIVAVIFGISIGPFGLNAFELSTWAEPLVLIEQVARLTVSLAVTSIALRLPENYFRRRWKSMAALLGPGMVIMWLVSGLVTYALLPVSFLIAMLIGAIITPTDPVLANSVVIGQTAEQNIPERLRYLLSGEAGANDGGAYPLVFLTILLLGQSTERALVDWSTRTLLVEVGGAIVLGILIGGVIGRLERWVSGEQFLEETSVFTITVALTLGVVGFVTLLGANEILAVFAAGLAYNWQADPEDKAKEQRVEEVFNRLFTLPAFVLFGMVIPWGEWQALGWTGIGLVVGILLLRRLPMMFAVSPAVRPLDRPAATVFMGWFGPIGIAAVFYATLAVRETGIELVWPVVTLLVTGSVLAHGMTGTLLTLRYGRLDDDAEWW